MSIKSFLVVVLLAAPAAWLVGCGQEEAVETGPPEGWQADGLRWWRDGQDTTGVFRKLETLVDMNVTDAEVTYAANPGVAARRSSIQQQLQRAVKQSLISFYRHQPELVDSLFERYLTPRLQDASIDGDLQERVKRYKKQSYKLLRSHFREPQMDTRLGRDVPVPYPDSLRERQVAGAVRIQVYLDEAGAPVALELLEGVVPTLDGIGMRATTQMAWSPAYRMRNGRWVPVPSWVRFAVRFGAS